MKLEDIIVGELSQSQKEKYCMISHVRNLTQSLCLQLTIAHCTQKRVEMVDLRLNVLTAINK